jgi:phosphatidyl-myo-inositol dimannoside synthase
VAGGLIISRGFHPNEGGAQRYIYDLYRNLPGEPYRVLTYNGPGAAEFDRLCTFNVTRAPRGAKGLWLMLAALFIVAREHTPHIHCGTVNTAWISHILQRVLGKEYLVFAHGREINRLCTGDPASRGMRALLNARTVVANSGFTKGRLLELGVAPDRIAVINPGVDTDLFRPMATNSALANRLGVAGRRVILSLGRTIERKGFDTIIRALPRIAAHAPDVCYLMVGTGPYLPRLRALISEMNVGKYVTIVERVEDELLPHYYLMADVFAMVSRTLPNGDCEGFGIVFLEAAACGLPVIGGLSGGIPDAVKHGVTGLLVDPTDVDKVSDAIVQVLCNKDLALSMGEAGRERVANEFSLRRQAGLLEKLVSRRFGCL